MNADGKEDFSPMTGSFRMNSDCSMVRSAIPAKVSRFSPIGIYSPVSGSAAPNAVCHQSMEFIVP